MKMDKISMVLIFLCALQVWKIEGSFFIIYQALELYIWTSVHFRYIVEFWFYTPKWDNAKSYET